MCIRDSIYAAQASDGDNWADDSPLCHELLAKKILPVMRYYLSLIHI